MYVYVFFSLIDITIFIYVELQCCLYNLTQLSALKLPLINYTDRGVLVFVYK